ncbi:MAG: alpha/beta fold hydrolase [Burkholderiales bacterium]
MRRLRWLPVILGALVAGVWLAIAGGFAAQAWWRLPELAGWHEPLEGEFSASDPNRPGAFADLLALEQRLFTRLAERMRVEAGGGTPDPMGRYSPDSAAATLALKSAGNRSSVLTHPKPTGAALLVHGLTDSPYMLSAIARSLNARGLQVVSLRLPGHGTVPGALTTVHRQDWIAAVELAARHAAELAGPGRPLVFAGFSTGGALSLRHALKALADPALPMPTDLVLLSPAIGISEMAAVSEVAASLAFIPGLAKARWLDVLPEFDPFKYNSFPVNAARQIWHLTRELERELAAAERAGTLTRLPRITTFQSLVDATVQIEDLARRLYRRLPAGKHELVVFDINRRHQLSGLMAPGPLQALERLRQTPPLAFRLTLVGNRGPDSDEVVEWVREPGERSFQPQALGLSWPPGVLSLGHLAIPLPAEDPIYGLSPAAQPGERAFTLGGRAPSAEAGALSVPLATLARMRSNPFHASIEQRLDAIAAGGAR